MGVLIILLVVGLGVGFWLIRRAGDQAQAAGHDRDRIATPDTPATREAIARWAQAHGYEPAGEGAALRYRKGNRVLSGQPTFLDVRSEGDALWLESYISTQTPLTSKPGKDMALGAPGFVLAVPRKSARREHDALRAELWLPPIA